MTDERATPDPDEPKLGLNEEGSGRRKVDPKPTGLPMTPSARRRLELVLDADRDSGHPAPIVPQAEPAPVPVPSVTDEALRTSRVPDPPKHVHAHFGPAEAKQLRRLARWVLACGILALATGGMAGAGAVMGRPGVVAHAIVGILTGALGFWLATAAYNFWRMARRPEREVHRLVDGLGLLRTAFLLKSVLLFATLTLGCFTFSLAAALLFMPT